MRFIDYFVTTLLHKATDREEIQVTQRIYDDGSLFSRDTTPMTPEQVEAEEDDYDSCRGLSASNPTYRICVDQLLFDRDDRVYEVSVLMIKNDDSGIDESLTSYLLPDQVVFFDNGAKKDEALQQLTSRLEEISNPQEFMETAIIGYLELTES